MKNAELIKKECFDVLKALLISLLLSLGLVLIFALIIRWASVGNGAIVPVNYAIKVLSVLVGCLIGLKNPSNGILKGAVAGLLYAVFSFLIFAAMDGFSTADFRWYDLICLTVAGGIAGVIAVNIRARKA